MPFSILSRSMSTAWTAISRLGCSMVVRSMRGRAVDEIELGEDEYFVLGDNRNHSSDSRDPSVGVLNREDLIGRAWVRIYPFQKMGVIRHE